MVKVTFDYGNKEDHVLIQEMISGEQAVVSQAKTLVEKVAAEKRAPEVVITEKAKPIIPDSTAEPVDLSTVTHGAELVITPAPVEYVDAEGGEVVVEAKTITAAEALPKVAAYCQAKGLDKPQAYFARIGKANIHELAPEQIVELLTELGIEV